jgi:hypothetical protein
MGETPHDSGVAGALASTQFAWREAGMPSVSKATGTRIDWGGPGVEWRAELEGYVASFVEIGVDTDLTELLKGLPDDVCPAPHWGYVFAGRTWWRYGGRDESFGAGEAFYVPPGHTSGADAGSQFVIFSPGEVMAEVEAHMGGRAQEMQRA